MKEVSEMATSQEVIVPENQELIDRQFAREGEVFELSIVETKVQQLQQIAGQSILEIGRLLSWTKERVGHGNFRASLERMGISYVSANAHMKLYGKIGKNPNVVPVQHLGITKALELVRNYEEEELEALSSGEEVDGRTLDELAGMSRTELKAALRRDRNKHEQELEAVNKQADALQKRNQKLVQQVERYESGSDGGWEFSAQWLGLITEQAQKVNSAAMKLEQLAMEWSELVESGDRRALAGHPFMMSNLTFCQSLIVTALDQCDGALQRAMTATHAELEFPAGTQYPALGFSANNLPEDMKFSPASIEEAEDSVEADDLANLPGYTEESLV